jgi:hypothetical protein
MAYVMRVLGMAGTYYNQDEMKSEGFPDPCYIAEYDLDYAGGRGRARLTGNLVEAVRFDSATDVLLAWRATSTTMPRRRDGRPNRPLTAYTITPEEV